MSSLTSVNLGSLLSAIGSSSDGIDVTSAVAQVIQTERAPEQQWQQQQLTLQTKNAAINTLSGLVSTLENKLNALSDPIGAFTSMKAVSSQPNILSASAVAGTPAGNHVIVVNNLATTASWYSSSVASATTPLPAGSFDITVGTGAPVTITVGSGVNTLNDLVTSINSQNLGVTASVVNDSNGSRLALVSTNSGSASDFTITNATGTTFTRAATGTNASLTVDGIPINSASNVVTGALTGVTLNLASAAPGTEVNINISPDSDQITQAVSDFVDAYNAVMKNVNSQFAFDQTANTAGPLAGDTTVRMLQSSLLGIGSYSSTGTVPTLGALGITMNDDGTLSLNTSTLNNAVQNNFSAVQSFLQGTASNGFASFLKTQLDSFTDPTSGAFTVELQSNSAEVSDLQDQIDNFELFIASETTRLTALYNQVDITLQQLPLLQKQIDAQLGNSGSNGK